jgi:hypothetical protein
MRDLERKLRTDLVRAILELEAPTPAQAHARRTELSQLSIDDLREALQRLRGKRGGTRGEGTAPALVVRAMLASEEEWLTMHEIADQVRALGHPIETDRVSTALSNLEFAHGRGHGVHDDYGVEVIRKRRPLLYRLVRRAPDAIYKRSCQGSDDGRGALMLREVTADTITEQQILAVYRAVLGAPQKTSYHRLILADCDAALDGSNSRRDFVARVYNEMSGSAKP